LSTGDDLRGELGGAFHQRSFEHRRMFLVDQRLVLLNVSVFVSDHVHEPILDVGMHIGGGAQRLESDLNAGDGAADTDGFAASNGDGDGRKFCLRIELDQRA
jgi:hypothetical protein